MTKLFTFMLIASVRGRLRGASPDLWADDDDASSSDLWGNTDETTASSSDLWGNTDETTASSSDLWGNTDETTASSSDLWGNTDETTASSDLDGAVPVPVDGTIDMAAAFSDDLWDGMAATVGGKSANATTNTTTNSTELDDFAEEPAKTLTKEEQSEELNQSFRNQTNAKWTSADGTLLKVSKDSLKITRDTSSTANREKVFGKDTLKHQLDEVLRESKISEKKALILDKQIRRRALSNLPNISSIVASSMEEGPVAASSGTDRYPQWCPGWAAAGYCMHTYVEWMAVNCAKSCAPKANEGTCVDVKGWHMSGYPTLGCDWFARSGSLCHWFGAGWMWHGHTANTACCACGGGKIVKDWCDTTASASSVSGTSSGCNCDAEIVTKTQCVNNGGCGTGITVREGMTVGTELAGQLKDVNEALETFTGVETVVKEFSEKLVAAGTIVSLVTLFLPEQPSAELQAIESGFNEVQLQIDSLSVQMTTAIADLKQIVVLSQLEQRTGAISDAQIAYENYFNSITTQGADRQLKRNYFSDVCNGNANDRPETNFRYLYIHGCSTCQIDPNWQRAPKQAITIIDEAVKNDPAKFKRLYGVATLSAMIEAMTLYASCGPEADLENTITEASAYYNIRKAWLGKMKEGIDEVAAHIQAKVNKIETEWPCKLWQNDIAPHVKACGGDGYHPVTDGCTKAVFDGLAAKYPDKHFMVLVYNNVRGFDKHTFYRNGNDSAGNSFCADGRSNHGKYHAKHWYKNFHIVWKSKTEGSRKSYFDHENQWFGLERGPCTKMEKKCPWYRSCDDRDYRAVGACPGGAQDVFGKSKVKNIVVSHGSGLKGMSHVGQFGSKNFVTRFNGGFTIAF